MSARRVATASATAVFSVVSLGYLTESTTAEGESLSHQRLQSSSNSHRSGEQHDAMAQLTDDDNRFGGMTETLLLETRNEIHETITQFRKMKVVVEDTKVKALVASRFVDLLSRSAVVMLEYKIHELLKRPDEELHGIHERSAKSLFDACSSHGGLMVKLGQYLSNNGGGLLPQQYVEALKPLQDACAPLPVETIHECIKEEVKKIFGDECTIESVFQDIDPVPLGSASLGQVHGATLKDGRRVALKVQRPNLDVTTRADMVALKVLSRAVERAFPGSGFEWMLPEFHETITAELDFTQEALNAERCEKMVRGFALHTGASLFNLGWTRSRPPTTIVPSYISELTTDKLLTMSYEEGFKANDTEKMKEHGINPRQVAAATCSLFAELMLVHGFVYVDSHPGNVFVKPRGSSAKGEFDIVLLDHGMYRRLDETFRAGYCNLWAGLVNGNDKQALKGVRQVGLEDKYLDVMGLALVYRIPPSILRADSPLAKQRLGTFMSKDSRKVLREHFRTKFGEDFMSPKAVNDFCERQSRDLIYCTRCANLVRGLNRQLGGTSIDRFNAFGSAAARGASLNPEALPISSTDADLITADLLTTVKAALNRPVMSEILAEQNAMSLQSHIVVHHTYSDSIDHFQMILRNWWKAMLLDLIVPLSGQDVENIQIG